MDIFLFFHEWVSLLHGYTVYNYLCSCVCVHAQSLSCVRLFVTSWAVAHQASLTVEFPRQEYWSGCHFLFQGIFLTQGSNLSCPHLAALVGRFFTTAPSGKHVHIQTSIFYSFNIRYEFSKFAGILSAPFSQHHL